MGIRAGLLVVAVAFLGVAPTAARVDAAGQDPPFRWRAIVEGPYGPPWNAGQRARMLRWMDAHGMNAYVHAPKEDLYQRTNWRDPYPAAQMKDFRREIRFSRAHGIEWIPNLSPAVPLIPTPAIPTRPPSAPLCFSCAEDLAAVLTKLEPFRRAGSRVFMVSFDDVVKALADPRDVAAYGGAGDEAFGRANGDFLTRLDAALRERSPGVRVLTVGADYSGTADTPYLQGLRATLARRVEVMWTGPGVPAADFGAGDARAYAEAIGRRPLLWDNWTNNDTAGNALPGVGTARIFLGPYRRRAGIATQLGGIFLNPANEADLNLLPFATAADFMRAPGRYRPRRSWLRAVAGLAGNGPRRRAVRASLRAWAETSYSTKLGPLEAPTFRLLSKRFLRRFEAGGGWPQPLAALAREQRLVMAAAQRLRRLRNRQIAAQAAPFLAAARQAAGSGLVAARLLAAERPALRARRSDAGFAGRATPPDLARVEELRSAYRAGRSEFQTSRRFVYGWRLGVGFDVPPYDAAPNALEEFFDAVDGFDAAFGEHADEAATSVRLLLGGRPIRLGRDGSFQLSGSVCGRVLRAVDGAGGRTAQRLPRCRSAP